MQQLQLQQPESVKRLLSDHVVIGARLDLPTATVYEERTYTTLGGRNFTLSLKEGTWRANTANVLETRQVEPNGLLVVLDDFLFPDVLGTLKNDTEKDIHVKQSTETSTVSTTLPTTITTEVYVVKETKEKKINDGAAAMTVITAKEAPRPRNVTFIDNVMQVLSLLKSGVRVFQHFLSRSNVSKLLNDGEFFFFSSFSR